MASHASAGVMINNIASGFGNPSTLGMNPECSSNRSSSSRMVATMAPTPRNLAAEGRSV